jgi:hypothetical protein
MKRPNFSNEQEYNVSLFNLYVLSVSETDGAKIQQFPELLRIAGLI